ncbi:MMPL family transporter [Embleya hyalina]|uniref:Membrane protein n=1 Tax=Embleya hyalina TaxID=516124 RepID=A0A401YN06_9ACTN|nr:MMPL family transporter [Embleya hyalina]GCD95993.1 membrane protein [Embleya hyalina]
MSALAKWCHRRRALVVLVWALALVALVVAGLRAGSATDDGFSLPGMESTRAMDLVEQALPERSGAVATVVWQVEPGHDVRDSVVRERMGATLDRIRGSASVGAVDGPYGTDPGAVARIAEGGRVAYADVTFARQSAEVPKADIRRVIDTARAARTTGLRVELGGAVIREVTEDDSDHTGEVIGVVAAAIVLFVAFGSFGATVLPILTALAGVGTGLMLVRLLSHTMSIGSMGPILGTLIGLGVGIDYALFIVTRHTAGLRAGLSVREAVVEAMDTSGRAVLFAGGTVVVALLGLFVLDMSYIDGAAVAASTTVVCTVLAAVTLLPALLGLLGERVSGRRERRGLSGPGRPSGRGRARASGPARVGVWVRWAGVVRRRPRVLTLCALGVIAVSTIPMLSIRLGLSDAGNDATSSTTRQSYDMLADGFGPGFNGPLDLVARVRSDADRAALTTLAGVVGRTPGVAAVGAPVWSPDARIGIVRVFPTTSPQSRATSDLIDRLRDGPIPAAEGATTLRVYVGGVTATGKDFAGVLRDKLPLFVTVIVALGFVLLLLAFRSVVVPITAAVMNLSATCASFGIVVAVFQFGWGVDALGAGAAGPVEATVPVIMVAILFGLSMDYQVFLISRMHEEWVRSRDNARAIAVGQIETGRVITAAAAIMVAVFMAFVFGGRRVIAEFGVGLTAAVALDAFVLRTVLVPALMHLIGRANWWLPAWLDRRLPRVSIDAPETAKPEQTNGPG